MDVIPFERYENDRYHGGGMAGEKQEQPEKKEQVYLQDSMVTVPFILPKKRKTQ